jgi:hypothetical protein
MARLSSRESLFDPANKSANEDEQREEGLHENNPMKAGADAHVNG